MSHCFKKADDGRLADVMVIEPISSSSLECMAAGAKTSFKLATGVSFGDASARDKARLPGEFADAVFCDEWAYRLNAAARTWQRPHAQDNLMDIVPLGKVRSAFNFSLDNKRVLNFDNVVTDDDNVKQDMSIDVYGRADKKARDEAMAAAAAEADAAAAAAKEAEADELDALLAAMAARMRAAGASSSSSSRGGAACAPRRGPARPARCPVRVCAAEGFCRDKVNVEARGKAASAGKTYRLSFVGSGETKEIDCPDDTYILDAAEAAGLDLPATCKSGICGTCVGRIASGTFDPSDIADISFTLNEDEQAQGLAMLCMTRPTSDLVIETQCDWGYSLGVKEWEGATGQFSATPDPLMGKKWQE
ncbi:Ferredoxin-1 [Scenedesmus sp. PABB004]|nr:Ferredoxin-1 [Scenedesmus sp. PABB004]